MKRRYPPGMFEPAYIEPADISGLLTPQANFLGTDDIRDATDAAPAEIIPIRRGLDDEVTD